MRSIFAKPAEDQEYTPVGDGTEDGDDETLTSIPEGVPFSWLEYSVFLMLGVAMLWAW
jgi:equilibrative nucleoside transporter 1/2/3